MSSVTVTCKKCGLLAIFNYDRSYKQVTQIVDAHKDANGKPAHRVIVRRES